MINLFIALLNILFLVISMFSLYSLLLFGTRFCEILIFFRCFQDVEGLFFPWFSICFSKEYDNKIFVFSQFYRSYFVGFVRFCSCSEQGETKIKQSKNKPNTMGHTREENQLVFPLFNGKTKRILNGTQSVTSCYPRVSKRMSDQGKNNDHDHHYHHNDNQDNHL